MGNWLNRGVLLSALLLVTGCPRRSAVWVVPGSTAERLEFGIGPARGDSTPIHLGGFRVYRCDGPSAGAGALWTVGVESADAPRLNRIRYGTIPPGYEGLEPVPLEAGCYRAAIGGTGTTRFVVYEDGNVTEHLEESAE